VGVDGSIRGWRLKALSTAKAAQPFLAVPVITCDESGAQCSGVAAVGVELVHDLTMPKTVCKAALKGPGGLIRGKLVIGVPAGVTSTITCEP